MVSGSKASVVRQDVVSISDTEPMFPYTFHVPPVKAHVIMRWQCSPDVVCSSSWQLCFRSGRWSSLKLYDLYVHPHIHMFHDCFQDHLDHFAVIVMKQGTNQERSLVHSWVTHSQETTRYCDGPSRLTSAAWLYCALTGWRLILLWNVVEKKDG